MSSTYNSTGNDPLTAGTSVPTALGAVGRGVDTALTWCASTTDPSTAAPVTWGSADVGRPWLDIGVDGSVDSPVLKVWQQIAAGPTYGWRRLRFRKVIDLVAPLAVTFSPASPAAADVAATDVDLTATLDGAGGQDSGQVSSAVRAVHLRIRVRTGASETITAATDHAYFEVKEKGSTTVRRLYAQISNRYAEQTIRVALDSSEIFQFLVKVGGGTPAFEYEAEIVAIEEEV